MLELLTGCRASLEQEVLLEVVAAAIVVHAVNMLNGE